MNMEEEGQKCQTIFEARQQRARDAVEALPPLGRWLLEQWRTEIEQAGRMRFGCCCSTLLQFALDIKAVMEPEVTPGRTLNLSEKGSGH